MTKQRTVVFYKDMSKRKNNITSRDQSKSKHLSEVAKPSRTVLEVGYENFKIGALIHEAKLEKVPPSAELTGKVGTSKNVHFQNRKQQ